VPAIPPSRAIQFYEQALQLNREETGNVSFADYGIANVHQLQGDLAGAKRGFEESLALTQKYGDQDWTANAMWSLGNLSLQEADFVGARKMYEQALTIRTSAGKKLSIAETQLFWSQKKLPDNMKR
jgi:tetratricopeptide (TPR) repeat protein